MSTPTFTMFHADCVGNAVNCLYSHKVEITDADTFRQAVRFDHVYAAYRDNYRSVGNFISANALPVDCDNDHSDNQADWITPEDVAAAFPNVAFMVHYSRHHLLMKSFSSPRPRFHVVFAIEPMTDAKAYADAKTQVQQYFPYFDTNALDAARFFFGTTEPIVEFHEGSITLTRFLADYAAEQRFAAADAESDTIPEGSRNSTMSHTAGCLLKRYGNTEEAYTRYLEQAGKCNPPLEDSELDTIWRCARHLTVNSDNHAVGSLTRRGGQNLCKLCAKERAWGLTHKVANSNGVYSPKSQIMEDFIMSKYEKLITAREPEYDKGFWNYARGNVKEAEHLEGGRNFAGAFELPTFHANQCAEAIKVIQVTE